jgi:lycopene cyclase domain-containing protein
MTYFTFLCLFLGVPLAVLGGLTWRDARQGLRLPPELSGAPVAITIVAHIFVAVLYTTPWDNYLVANSVWWYDANLVTGLTIGWVPIEEYTFFVLQTILTSLWLVFLARRLVQPAAFQPRPRLRWISTVVAGIFWLASALVLTTGWPPGTYLALILIWALPPIMVQFLFGADILWQQRRLVSLTLIPITLYLAAADALAITSGTWTISPAQSLVIDLAGVLPVEEFVFFLLTNTLIVFGVTLVQSRSSHQRTQALLNRLHRQDGGHDRWQTIEGQR